MATGQSRPTSLLLTSNPNDDHHDGVDDAYDGDVDGEDVDDDPPHTRSCCPVSTFVVFVEILTHISPLPSHRCNPGFQIGETK